MELILEPVDNLRLAHLCGPLDANLHLLEQRLGVRLNRRGHQFQVQGEHQASRQAVEVLRTLYADEAHEPVTPERIHLCLHALSHGVEAAPGGQEGIRTRRGVIEGRGPNQRAYIERIRRHDLSFGIGPAGTGKTYLAVACAVEALEREEVARLILARPAVEAGERLGFLPGDLSQKVDPYLRPLYDALYEMLGPEKVHRLLEKGVIEVAPLAFMRGRTLSEAFILLDEAQNTTPEQMKMLLTRIGFGSTAVVTGDLTQVDLPRGQKSGLREAREVLEGIEGVSFTVFRQTDVVRHALVQRIVGAYEKRATASP